MGMIVVGLAFAIAEDEYSFVVFLFATVLYHMIECCFKSMEDVSSWFRVAKCDLTELLNLADEGNIWFTNGV